MSVATWRMDERARRTLDGFLWDARGDGAGHVQVLRATQPATTLTSLDRSLSTRWELPWGRSFLDAGSSRGLFFVEAQEIRLLDADGRVSLAGSAPDLGGSDAAFVLACLSDGLVVARGRDIARVDDSCRTLWRLSPACAGTVDEAHVSDGRLLVATRSLEYTERGNLGPNLLLDLHDGTRIAELRGDRASAAGAGRFLVGLSGYDAFDTWLYERDGSFVQRWRSYGHTVCDPDGSFRVVECDRTSPTRSRVVRLSPDRSIERGPALETGQASPPVLLDDGTMLFLDAGRLLAVDRALDSRVLVELLPVSQADAWRFQARLVREGETLYVILTERAPDSSTRYTSHCWSLALSRR